MDSIELAQDRAILYLPHNALECEISAKVYLDGEIKTVVSYLDMDDIREAVRKADEGYIDEDDKFTLTDAGRAYVQNLLKGDVLNQP